MKTTESGGTKLGAPMYSMVALATFVACARPSTPPTPTPIDAGIMQAPADAGAMDVTATVDAAGDGGRPRRASCGPAVEVAWRRAVEGTPAVVFVRLLKAFADACGDVAPALAKGARAAAVLEFEPRVRALRDAALPELDARCAWASTEPMAEHPELPHCLTQYARPSVASAQPYFGGKDPGILCDVNAGTYLFLVAAEPYLGEQAYLIESALLLAARETSARGFTCWAHRR